METVAGVILQKLADQIVKDVNNQAQYAIDFSTELQEMKQKLKIVNGFFVDTNKLKEKKEVLKEALIQLRDLAYDADDVLTDCMVRDEYKKDGSCTCFSPNDLIFAYEMGKKLKDLNSRMGKIEKSLSTYLIQQQQTHQEENVNHAAGKGQFFSQHVDSSVTIGLENDVQKLKEWMFRKNIEAEVHKVGIVGLGGLGKTTLAKKVYDDKDVAASFDKRIWVTVSQDFNDRKITKSILDQLKNDASGSGHDTDHMMKILEQLKQDASGPGQDISQMLSEIQQLIQDQHCLIVMDDFWTFNPSWWQTFCSCIAKPAGQNTCIIITTREERVATSMGVDRSRIYKPKVLNKEESWALFCKFALSPGNNIFDDANIKRVAEKIVKKCGGLPLAIKTIAALLTSKCQLNEWKKVYEDFQLLTIGDNFPVMASLQLSYDALPSHLKQFFLCFSIYPEDFEIQAEQLVHWWVGEGLILGKDSKTATEMGYEYLAELGGRCLVDVVRRRGYDGKAYSCKMHDLVRDLAIKIAGEDTFCSFEGGKQKLAPTSRWLGFKRDENSTISLSQCSKLRAMILMSRIPESLTSHENMGSLSSLRVLDLSHGKLDEESIANLLKWIISLKRLAHLNLSGAAGLKQVPSSIRKLRNLQLLILSGCNNLVELHPLITYLKRLVVLDLGSCDNLLYLPEGIGMLNQLQELTGFKVSKSCHLLELECLVQLRVLRMSLSDESEISNSELEVLLKLKKLKVLSIDTKNCKKPSMLEKLHELKPPPGLEELYLRHYHHKDLPKWINPQNLSDLEYLSIEVGDITHIIGPSPDQSEEENDSEWKIVGLCLKFLLNLEEDWGKLKRFMPSLCYVEVSNCLKLKSPPYGENNWIWTKTASEEFSN